MISRVWVIVLLWGWHVWGHAQASISLETDNGRIPVLGQNYAFVGGVSPQQSRMVIYSLAEGALAGATSIFVNGSYHASLIKGAYTDLCYEPGSVELAARQMQVGQSPKDLPDTITALRLQGGQTHYLRVREQNGRPLLFPVPAAQALQELPSQRLQLHTLSRVARECVQAEPAQAAVAQPIRHTLAADVLFAFARSDRHAMTQAGRIALDRFMQQLQGQYLRIEHLHVIGHADPLGEPQANERLAMQRAQTVREYLGSLAQPGVRISAEGRGAREPVATGCGATATARAKACNQPNRRVVIEVTGLHR